MAINARQKERYERVRFDVNDDVNDHRDGRVAPCCCYCCRCIRDDHYPIFRGCAMKCDACTNQPSMTHTRYRIKPMLKKSKNTQHCSYFLHNHNSGVFIICFSLRAQQTQICKRIIKKDVVEMDNTNPTELPSCSCAEAGYCEKGAVFMRRGRLLQIIIN